jgi:hypothetical protein
LQPKLAKGNVTRTDETFGQAEVMQNAFKVTMTIESKASFVKASKQCIRKQKPGPQEGAAVEDKVGSQQPPRLPEQVTLDNLF